MKATIVLQDCNGVAKTADFFGEWSESGEIRIGDVKVDGQEASVFTRDCIRSGYNNGRSKKERSTMLGIQQYHTDVDAVGELINHVGFDEIAVVLFNPEIVKRLVEEGFGKERIVFISDQIRRKAAYLNTNGCRGVKTIGYNENIRSIGEEVERAIRSVKNRLGKMNINYTTTHLITNPPYDCHISILNDVLDKFDRANVVHPATYLLVNKEKTRFSSFNDRYGHNIESVKLFDGNGDFNVKLSTAWTVTAFDMHKTSPEIIVIDETSGKHDEYIADGIGEITWMGSRFTGLGFSGLFQKVKNHICQHGSLDSHNAHAEDLTDYSFKTGQWAGNINEDNGIMDDFFTLACKELDNNLVGKDYAGTKQGREYLKMSHTHTWAFPDAVQRMNFAVYLKSKIARFFLSYYKINKHVDRGELSIVPWMDFDIVWNDQKLKEKFGITDEQWDCIDNFIPDYYDDYRYDAE